ncbi:MAG: chorismate-binding protein, partial [Armatimonadota bacterium]
MNDCDRIALDAPGSVLIDDWDPVTASGSTFLFANPQSIISATSTSELENALEAISDMQSQGKYLAGYISYDAGLSLDTPLITRHDPDVPLLWFGVYDSMKKIDYTDSDIPEYKDAGLVSDTRLNISDDEYLQSVARIKEYIAAGDVYQVNYTCKLLFRNAGTPLGLFARLRKAHPVCHSAFINIGDFQVMSLSPELFLRVTDNRIQSRPMKGTIHRGLSYDEDARLADTLQSDIKNRAENVMIVDLMR